MKTFRKKVIYAIIFTLVILVAFIGFSKTGILFSANSGNDVTVSTFKQNFDTKNYMASIAKINDTEKKEDAYNDESLDDIKRKLNDKLKGALVGMSDLLVSSCVSKGMDPYLLAAISVLETGNGSSYAANNYNNFGGIMCGGKLCVYETKEAGINKFVDVVYNNYFLKGLTTAEQMNPRYAASSTWAQKVNYHYNNLKR